MPAKTKEETMKTFYIMSPGEESDITIKGESLQDAIERAQGLILEGAFLQEYPIESCYVEEIEPSEGEG